MKNSILIVFVFLIMFFSNVSAQEHSEEKEHKPGLEAVLTGVSFYTPENGDFELGNEFLITYWTSHKWAFGGAYAIVYEDSGRIGHELSALVSHKPWTFLTINAGPTFIMPNSHRDTEVAFTLEAEYNYFFGNSGWHTGPVIGAQFGEHFKLMTGIHIGYEF
ncbi:hypothetical protein [Galbibacter mesophilus]|uniref:hypothetical protein n=1 Tax=Galbibacter mesophilus TaxID=379069 RepID=UPI00191EA32F|nr:hypothetical protein [Galbibacter mesophilus]MCM5662201.1 hypothetical protein [Galbibacter mesophilus]